MSTFRTTKMWSWFSGSYISEVHLCECHLRCTWVISESGLNLKFHCTMPTSQFCTSMATSLVLVLLQWNLIVETILRTSKSGHNSEMALFLRYIGYLELTLKVLRWGSMVPLHPNTYTFHGSYLSNDEVFQGVTQFPMSQFMSQYS